MISYIKGEIFKYRKTKVKFCSLVGFIPAIIAFIMYGFNDKYNHLIIWEEYLNLIITFTNDIIAPIVYGIIASYIFGHEYETKTMNILFTYPINRIKILFSKFASILYIIAVNLTSILVAAIILGLFINHESLNRDLLIYYFFALVKMIIYHFMLVIITCAVAICTRSVLSGIIFVISATFLNLVIVNTHFSAFYPWSAPVLLSPHENVGRTFTPSVSLFIVLVICFIIGTIICVKKYKYVE